MRLTLYFLIGIFLLSCGNASISSNNTATDTSSLTTDTVRPVVIDAAPNPSTSVSISLSDRRIKAIDDIYFGIPSSEHGRHFNKQITLGDCNFKVKYLGYNDYSLGDNTISGLYSFRINSESVCSDIEYLVTLFSTKYGQPRRIISNETVAIPDLKDVREIEKWDNSYVAMMEGSLPGESNNQQTSRLYVTDENTNFPKNEIIQQTLYKWDTDSISIELNEGFEYLPIGSRKNIKLKGPKSGGVYDCETVDKFVLIKKPFIDFVHPNTAIKLKEYLDKQKIKTEKDKFKKDGEKL